MVINHLLTGTILQVGFSTFFHVSPTLTSSLTSRKGQGLWRLRCHGTEVCGSTLLGGALVGQEDTTFLGERWQSIVSFKVGGLEYG